MVWCYRRFKLFFPAERVLQGDVTQKAAGAIEYYLRILRNIILTDAPQKGGGSTVKNKLHVSYYLKPNLTRCHIYVNR